MAEEAMTRCPYNPLHTFSKEKYVWHISRCGDKAKVQHLFITCKYNSMHIVKRADLLAHQETCPDRARSEGIFTALKQLVFESKGKPRERSRQNSPVRCREPGCKWQKMEDEEEGLQGIEQCEQCRVLLQEYMAFNDDPTINKYLRRLATIK